MYDIKNVIDNFCLWIFLAQKMVIRIRNKIPDSVVGSFIIVNLSFECLQCLMVLLSNPRIQIKCVFCARALRRVETALAILCPFFGLWALHFFYFIFFINLGFSIILASDITEETFTKIFYYRNISTYCTDKSEFLNWFFFIR